MYQKTGILFLLFAAMNTSALEAQGFRTLGTRRGAITGAVIGGIIGGQNDEVAAGIIAGGLIGGATGRFIGSRVDQNRAYGGQQYPQYQQGYSPQPQQGYGYQNQQQFQQTYQPQPQLAPTQQIPIQQGHSVLQQYQQNTPQFRLRRGR